jgi:uncharacterized protein YuzB (UPF0349 family)
MCVVAAVAEAELSVVDAAVCLLWCGVCVADVLLLVDAFLAEESVS